MLAIHKTTGRIPSLSRIPPPQINDDKQCERNEQHPSGLKNSDIGREGARGTSENGIVEAVSS